MGEPDRAPPRRNWRAVRAGALLAIAFLAAVVYLQTLPRERGSIDIYGRRLSDLPDLAQLTHQQAVDRVRQGLPGKLLGVRLRERNETLVYEVEWVASRGDTVWVFLIDAGDGVVLSRREIPNRGFVPTR